MIVGLGAASGTGTAVDPIGEGLASDRKEFAPTMALTQTEHGDAAVSLRELETEVRIPRRARELYAKALDAERKGNREWAVERMRTATEMAPGFFQAHAALAVAYLNTGRTEEAEQHLEISLRLDPDYLPAREVKGLMLFFRGKFEEAADLLGGLVKRAPCRKTIHYFLAQALLKLGKSERAQYHFQTAEDLARRPRPTATRPWGDSNVRPRSRSPWQTLH